MPKIVNKNILKEVCKPRPKNSHKYNFGYLLVVGGSQLYSGSPAIAAIAALRAGVDMSLIIAPERSANIIASFSPNFIAYPLKGHDIGSSHVPAMLSFTKAGRKVSNEKIAVLIGNGLGRDEETQKATRDYLSQIQIPVVIDADGIWAVAKDKKIFRNKKIVLNCHDYGFYILSKIDISGLEEKKKAEAIGQVAADLGVTIIVTGNTDIISDGREIVFNKTGTPDMTVGGTGDVLAGICGCFLSQGIEPFLAAKVATYINGKAGELASNDFGVGLLATDIVDNIPRVMMGGHIIGEDAKGKE